MNVKVILGHFSLAPHMWLAEKSHRCNLYHQSVAPLHGCGSVHSRLFVVSNLTITLWPKPNQTGEKNRGRTRPTPAGCVSGAAPKKFPYSAQPLCVDIPKLVTHTHTRTHTNTNEHSHFHTCTERKAAWAGFCNGTAPKKYTKFTRRRRNPLLCGQWVFDVPFVVLLVRI